MDIPRTPLSKGAKFGETITAQALTFAVRREPVAKKLVMDIAEDLFDKWFVVDEIAKSEQQTQQGKTLDENVQTVLEQLNAKSIFTRAVQHERRYGWSIVVLGFKDNAKLEEEAKNPTEIDHLATYSPRAVTVDKEDEDAKSERFGLPVIYKIDRGKNQSMRVHYTRVLHIATRLDEHPWAGIPVLETIWDDMTVYRNMRWAAGQVYWRMPGLMVFTLPKSYEAADVTSFLTSLGDPNARTLLALPEDKKLEILGAEGKVLSPEKFTNPILRSISMGAGIPKTKLEGTEAGAVTGSEVNQREYYKYLSDQQKGYENQTVGALIDLLMKIGQVTPDIDYKITWANSFQLDTATEKAAQLADAQAAVLELKYSMIDEVRARRGQKSLKEVSNGKLDGQVLLSPQQLSSFNPGNLSADLLLPDSQSTLDRFLSYVRNFGRSSSESDARRPRGPADIEKSLAGGLSRIIQDYHNGGFEKDTALAKGQQLIELHYTRVVDASKKQLNRQTLPPEAAKRLDAKRLQAVADFSRVLDDVKH
jgi:phage-related protein (TIGR01555 family)